MSTVRIGFDLTRAFTSAQIGPSSSLGIDDQAFELGVVFKDDIGNVYKFVKNSYASSTAIGDVGAMDVAGGLSTTVKQMVTGSLNLLAGVWMGVVATSGYGFIQKIGTNSSILTDGTTDTVLGDSLKGVNTAQYLVKDQATGTEATYVNTVICLEAYTTATPALKKGYIHCPYGL
jgi:hypothetical protein